MKRNLHRRFTAPIAIVAIAGLALAGCSSSTEGGDGGGGDSGSAVPDYGTADGIVTVYGTIADTEAELLEKSWADWETENKIDIQYESSKEFEAQIGVRAQGGNAPDIAIFPQPGLLADLASRDYIQPAPDAVKANVESGWSADWSLTMISTVLGRRHPASTYC